MKNIKKGSVVSGAYVEYECNDVDNASSVGEHSLSHLTLMSFHRHPTLVTVMTNLIIALSLALVSLRDFTHISSKFLMHVV